MGEHEATDLVGRRRQLGLAVPVAFSLAVASAGLRADDACGLLLEARFVESAPRDRFELANRSSDGTRVLDAALELAGSVGELVFDTVDGGTGVEVFQPFRVEEGAALLVESTPPEDGGERVDLVFEGFGPGLRFVFSIDVDDRLARSELGQIRVAGSEIEGASLTVSVADADGAPRVRTATFGADARASVSGDGCDG